MLANYDGLRNICEKLGETLDLSDWNCLNHSIQRASTALPLGLQHGYHCLILLIYASGEHSTNPVLKCTQLCIFVMSYLLIHILK